MLALSVIGWIVIGGLAGWIGSKIMGTDAQMGLILNIVVGIVGAVIGGFIMRSLGFAGQGGMLYTILVAILGAVILTLIIRLFTRGRTTT